MVDLSVVSVLPPILVLLIGYLTHRVLLALVCGVVFAALLANNFAAWASANNLLLILWNNLTTPSNLHIFIFLLLLGIIIVMLQFSGGAYAYTQYVRKKIQNKRSAETASLILSTGLFLDDYLSSLTVGSVMHPLADSKHIAKVKQAFLVHTMAVPLCILCPFSGWVAAVLGFLSENGISSKISAHTLVIGKPFTAYVHIVPYLFYPFMLIATTWFIVRCKISFGLMRKHELIASETHNLYGNHAPPKYRIAEVEHNPHHTTLLEFFLPVFIMLLSCIVGVLAYSSAATGLMVGGLITTVLCLVFFVARGRLDLPEIPKVFIEGTKLMYSCIIVLLLAWTLGDFLRNQLFTGEYLASLMMNGINISALPMIAFFASMVITCATGSAWGSAAMIFPIVIPMVLSMTAAPFQPHLTQVPMLFPVLGAVLSGCLAGNHISPLADTTIMSCLSTRANLKDHVYTQFQYALPGIVATGLSFWLCGILLHYNLLLDAIVPVMAAILVTCITLRILTHNDRKVSA